MMALHWFIDSRKRLIVVTARSRAPTSMHCWMP
jgi:hypothetical protein